MDNLPRRLNDSPSALARVATYVLVPVILVLVAPLILLVILLLYLLAILHGARVFIFSFTGKDGPRDLDSPGPHFLDMPATARELPDESSSSAKG